MTQILVEEPYFNEPGRDAQRRTPEGQAASQSNNLALRIDTVRHAMIAHLRQTTPDLEELVRAHFLHMRDRLLATCRRELVS